jgi:hypothetical protein
MDSCETNPLSEDGQWKGILQHESTAEGFPALLDSYELSAQRQLLIGRRENFDQ